MRRVSLTLILIIIILIINTGCKAEIDISESGQSSISSSNLSNKTENNMQNDIYKELESRSPNIENITTFPEENISEKIDKSVSDYVLSNIKDWHNKQNMLLEELNKIEGGWYSYDYDYLKFKLPIEILNKYPLLYFNVINPYSVNSIILGDSEKEYNAAIYYFERWTNVFNSEQKLYIDFENSLNNETIIDSNFTLNSNLLGKRLGKVSAEMQQDNRLYLRGVELQKYSRDNFIIYTLPDKDIIMQTDYILNTEKDLFSIIKNLGYESEFAYYYNKEGFLNDLTLDINDYAKKATISDPFVIMWYHKDGFICMVEAVGNNRYIIRKTLNCDAFDNITQMGL